MRKLTASAFLLFAILAIWATPAHACSVDDDYHYTIRYRDLAGLNQPDSALAANYEQWLDERRSEEFVEPTPPTITGATLYEVVAATEETDSWSQGLVVMAIEQWGVPPLPTNLSRRPVNIDNWEPGSCDNIPSGSVGRQFITVRSDRGDSQIGLGDDTRDHLETAFGTSTVIPVNADVVEATIRKYETVVGASDVDSAPDEASAPIPAQESKSTVGPSDVDSAPDEASAPIPAQDSKSTDRLLFGAGALTFLGAAGLAFIRLRSAKPNELTEQHDTSHRR